MPGPTGLVEGDHDVDIPRRKSSAEVGRGGVAATTRIFRGGGDGRTSPRWKISARPRVRLPQVCVARAPRRGRAERKQSCWPRLCHVLQDDDASSPTLRPRPCHVLRQDDDERCKHDRKRTSSLGVRSAPAGRRALLHRVAGAVRRAFPRVGKRRRGALHVREPRGRPRASRSRPTLPSGIGPGLCYGLQEDVAENDLPLSESGSRPLVPGGPGLLRPS